MEYVIPIYLFKITALHCDPAGPDLFHLYDFKYFDTFPNPHITNLKYIRLDVGGYSGWEWSWGSGASAFDITQYIERKFALVITNT